LRIGSEVAVAVIRSQISGGTVEILTRAQSGS
jgi:hypothetical protein